MQVDFGKFDVQNGQDMNTNYLRQSAYLLERIARVPEGQSTHGLLRTFIIVFMGGGVLRTKMNESISFQKYFPEATGGKQKMYVCDQNLTKFLVIHGSELDIIDFMEGTYKTRLSDENKYGKISLHVMELDSLNEYRRNFKASFKIKEIISRQMASE